MNNTLAPGYLLQLKEELEQNYTYTYTLELVEKEYQEKRYRLCKELKKNLDTTPMHLWNKKNIWAQSGMLGNVKKEGCNLMGTPAFDYKEYLKSYAIFKKLPK